MKKLSGIFTGNTKFILSRDEPILPGVVCARLAVQRVVMALSDLSDPSPLSSAPVSTYHS